MFLISMTDFVVSQIVTEMGAEETLRTVISYAEFLQEPLTLGMFVPCDEEGYVLKEPERYEQRNCFDEIELDFDAKELYEYIHATEKVLFKGFDVVFDDKVIHKSLPIVFSIDEFTTIESVAIIWDEIELTESAIKQIGLI